MVREDAKHKCESADDKGITNAHESKRVSIKLYHGSDQIIDKPAILKPVRRTDFGYGFYTTDSKKQAMDWARSVCIRRGSFHSYVSEYEFTQLDGLNILRFDGPTEEWFDFVMKNRSSDFDHKYDIVIGPVADDGVYRVLYEYERGRFTKNEAIHELKSTRLDGQILFHTYESLKCLIFIGYTEAS